MVRASTAGLETGRSSGLPSCTGAAADEVSSGRTPLVSSVTCGRDGSTATGALRGAAVLQFHVRHMGLSGF